MKIKAVELFGVGRHQGGVLSGLRGGFTLVHGSNEAGKSTLLAGIRGILFGRILADEPKIMVTRAAEGRIVLEQDDGAMIVVERGLGKKAAPRIHGSDGSVWVGQDALKQIFQEFQAVEDSLYQSVFTFQLSELTDLGRADAALHGRLYTIGLLGKRAPIEVEQVFLSRAREIFNPDRRARSPRLNQLLKDIDNLTAQIRTKKDTASDYEYCLRQLEQARKTYAESEEITASAGQALAMAQKDLEALPLHRRLSTLMERLHTMPEARITETYRERVAGLNHQIDSAQDRLRELDATRQEWLNQASALHVEPDWLEAWPELHRLQSVSSGVYEQAKTLEGRRKEAATLTNKLDAAKSQLSGQWPDDDVLKLTLPASLYDAAERSKAEEDRIRRELEHIQRIRAGKEQALSERYADLAAHGVLETMTLADAEHELRTVQQRLELARERTELLAELDRRVNEVGARQRDFSVAQRLNAEFKHGAGKSILLPVVAWGLSLVVLVLAGWSWMGGRIPESAVLVVFGLLGIWMGEHVRRTRGQNTASLESVLRMQAQAEELEQLRAQIRPLCARLGLDGQDPSHPDALDRVRSRLREELTACEQQRERGTTIAQLVQARASVQVELQRLDAERRHLESAMDACLLSWRAVMSSVDSRLETLTPSAFLREADILKQVRADVFSLRELQSVRLELSSSLHRFHSELTKVLGRLQATQASYAEIAVAAESIGSVTASEVERWIQVLNAVAAEADEQRQRDLQRAACQSESERCTAVMGQESEKLDTFLAEKQQLFDELGIADDAQFRQRVHLEEERRELEAGVREAQSELHGLYGGLRQYQDRIPTLSSATEDMLEDAVQSARETYQSCKANMDNALKQVLAAEQQLKSWETGAGAMDVAWQLSAAHEDRSRLAREWAVYTLAAQLVRSARESFEQSHRPRALVHAGSLLERVTEGRYVQLHARADEKGNTLVLCMDRHGRSWQLGELSRGTREQVYLALRLAVVHDYADRGIHMPIVLDDVMVNFDARRQAVFLDVLREVATMHQVIYLTCHQGLFTLADSMSDIQCLSLDGNIAKGD